MKIKNFSLFLCALLLMITSCEKVEKQEVLGNYAIDKAVIRDSVINEIVYDILELKDDMTFELRYCDNSQVKKTYGNWEIVNSKFRKNSSGYKEPLVKIRFHYKNRVINGELKGTIIYFSYPDDLYSGKFENIIYVKYNGKGL